jgi:type VI secretion system protein ImpG
MDSVPVEETRCRFRTTADVRLYPMEIEAAALETPLSQPAYLRIGFTLGQQASGASLDWGRVRFFLHGELPIVNDLYLWLCRHVRSITLRAGTRTAMLRPSALVPAGFGSDEPLWPYPDDAFLGFRLLQEYFAFPERFHFLDLVDLQPLAQMDVTGKFEIVIEFDERPPETVRVKPGMLRLGCTPVVNLAELKSAPLHIDHRSSEYRMRPDVSNPAHYEIFSVNHVIGWQKTTMVEREYKPFFSYEHTLSTAEGSGNYYQTRLRPATVGSGTETYISFAPQVVSGQMPPPETVACDLTCTNRDLPLKLRTGDINTPTSESPAFAEFANIARVTPTIAPPLEDRLLWHLISHQSLNYLSLSRVESLRAILSTYNFGALVDRQIARSHQLRIEGIRGLRARPAEILRHGATYRGLEIELEAQEDRFAGDGDVFLLASVLNQFLSIYATLNSYTRLTVRGVQKGSLYQWPPMLGSQPLL